MIAAFGTIYLARLHKNLLIPHGENHLQLNFIFVSFEQLSGKDTYYMKLIDLHIHSTASDGSLTPTEVVNRANDLGLTAMALTDHDTVAGIDEALEAAKDLDMEVIPGIEVSCIYKEKEIHILGLYIDHKDPELLAFLKEASRKRYDRNMEMLAVFNKDGFEITEEDLLCGNPGTVITRAHFARALLKRGYVTSVDQAFKKYLNPDRPYYRSRELITPEEVLAALLGAGGFPVLAHPLQYKLGWTGTEELVSMLTDHGLRGLECFHSSNNQDESGKLRKLAKKYSLAPTGGSDFHGAAKPDIEIGSGRGGLRVSALYLDDIKLSMFMSGMGKA